MPVNELKKLLPVNEQIHKILQLKSHNLQVKSILFNQSNQSNNLNWETKIKLEINESKTYLMIEQLLLLISNTKASPQETFYPPKTSLKNTQKYKLLKANKVHHDNLNLTTWHQTQKWITILWFKAR